MFDLKGKRALVTGSTQGIGLEIARLLAQHGAEVYVHGATSVEKCESVTASLENARTAVVDLRDGDCAEKLYAITGDVDILVLNASVQYKRAWNEYTPEEYDDQLNCNLRASYLLMCKYSEGMKKRGHGRIVTVGSVNQYNQHPELALYAVTKAAQKKLVENIAPQLAPYGVTVNNVAPGAIATPRNEKITSDTTSRAKVEAAIPAGRFGTPKDVAPAVLFLCSDEAAYITGAELLIDGGMRLK